MSYETEKTSAGLKVYQGGVHIKTVPSKFESVIQDVVFETKAKRLLNEERLLLEGELVKKEIKAMPAPEKYIFDQIKDATAQDCIWIQTRTGENSRSVMVFTNGVEVKCSKSFLALGSGLTKNQLY